MCAWFACSTSRAVLLHRRAQKRLNHFTSDHKWMAMPAAELRHHRPDVVIAGEKCRLDLLNGFHFRRWAVHQRNDGRIASAS